MSVSLSIRAVLTTDEKYDKMYAVYEACNDAGISYPEEDVIVINPVYDEERCERVYTVELDDLPESTRAIRVDMSW